MGFLDILKNLNPFQKKEEQPQKTTQQQTSQANYVKIENPYQKVAEEKKIEEIAKNPEKYGYVKEEYSWDYFKKNPPQKVEDVLKVGEKVPTFVGQTNIILRPKEQEYETKTQEVKAYGDVNQKILYVEDSSLKHLHGSSVQVQVGDKVETFKIVVDKAPSGLQEATLTIEQKIPKKPEYFISLYDKERAEKIVYRSAVEQNLKDPVEAVKMSVVSSYFSWEDPFRLRMIYNLVTGKPERAYEVFVESNVDVLRKFKDADISKIALNVITSPGGSLLIGYGAGRLLGFGLGAASKVLPKTTNLIQIGLGIGAGAYITYDIGKEVINKNYEEAFVKSGTLAIQTPFFVAGYKSGFEAGFKWANQKWIEKNLVFSKTEITNKIITEGAVYYKGKYEAFYKPNLEAKEPIKIKGEFYGVLAQNEKIHFITESGKTLTLEPGQTLTSFRGYGIYKDIFGSKKIIQIETITKGLASRNYGGWTLTLSRGLGVAGKENYFYFQNVGGTRLIDQRIELIYEKVELRTFKPGEQIKYGITSDVLGFTDFTKRAIWIREDILYSKEGAITIKHELLHRIFPFSSESKILAFEKDTGSDIDKVLNKVIKNFYKTGELNFYEQAGARIYNIYEYRGLSAGYSKYGKFVTKELGLIKDPIAEKRWNLIGLKTFSLTQTIDQPVRLETTFKSFTPVESARIVSAFNIEPEAKSPIFKFIPNQENKEKQINPEVKSYINFENIQQNLRAGLKLETRLSQEEKTRERTKNILANFEAPIISRKAIIKPEVKPEIRTESKPIPGIRLNTLLRQQQAKKLELRTQTFTPTFTITKLTISPKLKINFGLPKFEYFSGGFKSFKSL